MLSHKSLAQYGARAGEGASEEATLLADVDVDQVRYMLYGFYVCVMYVGGCGCGAAFSPSAI